LFNDMIMDNNSNAKQKSFIGLFLNVEAELEFSLPNCYVVWS
jgi:hypothetical protein